MMSSELQAFPGSQQIQLDRIRALTGCAPPSTTALVPAATSVPSRGALLNRLLDHTLSRDAEESERLFRLPPASPVVEDKTPKPKAKRAPRHENRIDALAIGRAATDISNLCMTIDSTFEFFHLTTPYLSSSTSTSTTTKVVEWRNGLFNAIKNRYCCFTWSHPTKSKSDNPADIDFGEQHLVLIHVGDIEVHGRVQSVCILANQNCPPLAHILSHASAFVCQSTQVRFPCYWSAKKGQAYLNRELYLHTQMTATAEAHSTDTAYKKFRVYFKNWNPFDFRMLNLTVHRPYVGKMRYMPYDHHIPCPPGLTYDTKKRCFHVYGSNVVERCFYVSSYSNIEAAQHAALEYLHMFSST